MLLVCMLAAVGTRSSAHCDVGRCNLPILMLVRGMAPLLVVHSVILPSAFLPLLSTLQSPSHALLHRLDHRSWIPRAVILEGWKVSGFQPKASDCINRALSEAS